MYTNNLSIIYGAVRFFVIADTLFNWSLIILYVKSNINKIYNIKYYNRPGWSSFFPRISVPAKCPASLYSHPRFESDCPRCAEGPRWNYTDPNVCVCACAHACVCV